MSQDLSTQQDRKFQIPPVAQGKFSTDDSSMDFQIGLDNLKALLEK